MDDRMSQAAYYPNNEPYLEPKQNDENKPICSPLFLMLFYGRSIHSVFFFASITLIKQHNLYYFGLLDIKEIKTIPFTPISHPLIERLIGTIRREYIDQLFFWNENDLQQKLDRYKRYYNDERVHASLDLVPTLIAPAIAPALGRVIEYLFSWKWVFLFVVPSN